MSQSEGVSDDLSEGVEGVFPSRLRFTAAGWSWDFSSLFIGCLGLWFRLDGGGDLVGCQWIGRDWDL